MRRKWCRRRLDMLSIKPRQRAGEEGVMFKLVKSSSSEVHCETLFQKVWVDLQCQKRCVSVSGEPAQKEQESVSFLPILSLRILQLALLCYVNNNTLSSKQRRGFYNFNGNCKNFKFHVFSRFCHNCSPFVMEIKTHLPSDAAGMHSS